jgi:hypothetical protein
MANKVTIFCAGGCGRSITLHSNKVHKADYYVCATGKDGAVCLSKIPQRPAGTIPVIDMHAAGGFWGYTDKLAMKRRPQRLIERGIFSHQQKL